MSKQIVVVVSGGESPSPTAARLVPTGATVVAADRGLEHALALGLEVSVAVGDFDSASPEVVDVAAASGVRIVRHPPEKDASDLELALDTALELAPARILVLAGRGGRLDHELSTLLLLASSRYASAEVDAFLGETRVHAIHRERELDGEPGELLTLLPVHGDAVGVTTEGLAYPLRGERLEAGTSRGVSNVFEGTRARISLEAGALLAIRPGPES